MTTSPPARGPLLLKDYLPGTTLLGAEGELRTLARLEAAGLPVAPTRVVSAEEEARFYRLNNLPARLTAIFADLELADPDEDEIEERAPEAEALVRTHFLLDEFIDLFYASLHTMPSRLSLRRPAEAAGAEAARGRPALLALKTLWAFEWRAERVMARLAASASVALEARPVLIQPAGSVPAPPAVAREAATLLGEEFELREIELWQHPEFGLTRVRR